MALRPSGIIKTTTPQRSKRVENAHPFDETWDSIDTADLSFLSADKEENLTVSRLVEQEEQGLETPLVGINRWKISGGDPNDSLTEFLNSEPAAPQDPAEHECIEATIHGVELDLGNAPQRCNSKGKTEPGGLPWDPDDRSCIEATLHGVELDQLLATAKAKEPRTESHDEEGVEHDLNDYKKSTRLILLDLKGTEVDTIGKKVRFEIDSEKDRKDSKKTGRRRKMMRLLHKKKRSKDAVGCPPLVKMTIESPTNVIKDAQCPGPRENMDKQADKLTGVVIELYDSFLKAVVESYLLCQYTGAYIEEEVLNYADTEFLRELLSDDGTIIDVGPCKDTTACKTNVNEDQLAETFSFEVHPSEQATGRLVVQDDKGVADV